MVAINLMDYHPIGPFQEFMAAAMRLCTQRGDTFRTSGPVTHAVDLAWESRYTGDRNLLREAWDVLDVWTRTWDHV